MKKSNSPHPFSPGPAAPVADPAEQVVIQALREQFRAVAQTATDAIISADGNGLILFWNNRASALFGYSEEEALGRPVTIIIPERLQERHCAALHRTRVTGLFHLAGRTLETMGRNREGTEIPIELSLSAWESGGEVHFTAIIRDISERKKIEAALRSSEERYRIIFESTKEGIIVADRVTRRFQYVNPSMCALFGYTAEEFRQLTVTDLHPEASWPQVSADFEALAQGQKTIAPDTPCRRKDGTLFFADITATPMKIDDRFYLVGFFTDTTQRKKVEEILLQAQVRLEQQVRERTADLQAANDRLREEIQARKAALEALEHSERKFEAIFNQTFQLIGLLTPDGTILEINQSTLDYLDLNYKDVIGKSLLTLKAGTVPSPLREQVRQGIAAAARGKFVRFEMPVDLPPKSRQWIDFSIKPVSAKRGRAELLIVEARDISEIKKSELALQDSEKRLRLLSSQVLLAQETERKRIAKELHDGIGQYLSAIKYRVENALLGMTAEEPSKGIQGLQAVVPVIQETIGEIRNICMDLRPSILDDLGILATISWFTRDFQETYPGILIDQDIRFKEDQCPENLKTVIFRIIQEALNNVAKHSGASRVRLHMGRHGPRLDLEIGDNGRGFPIRQATSKEFEGRGLGLAGMQERAELSGGTFKIYSRPSRGTKIRASWPLINADAG